LGFFIIATDQRGEIHAIGPTVEPAGPATLQEVESWGWTVNTRRARRVSYVAAEALAAEQTAMAGMDKH
jgi:hypothetical protein